ncbi:glycosyl transferase family 41-domain-containing protein [Chlamydoabsidia padenii]|nr:glycosyl transferase family 41-domain-containing protein [Chlamydoabsidia padenii]
MVPPQSPTLASYYYEGSNGWVNHYYDASKQYLSPRAQVDRQPIQPMEDQQQAYSHHQRHHQHQLSAVSSMRQQQQQIMQQHYMAQQQSNYQRLQLHHHHLYDSSIETNNPALGVAPHYPASQPAFDMNQQQTILLDPTPGLLGSQPSSSSISHHIVPPALSQQSAINLASPRSRATHQLNQLMSSIADPSITVSAPSSSSTLTHHHSPLILPPYASAESREEWRENILQYAHNLYAQSPQHPLLLTVLHSLHDTFPHHLPTLLLLACVYYTHQDYQQSLRYNHLILNQDPHYVEAMSNIGTTLRSLGRTSEAEHWWYQAVQLRPGYWDAVENLVGVLCSVADNNNKTSGGEINEDHSMASDGKKGGPPRYKEALAVCEYVEQHFFSTKKSPIRLPDELPVHQLPRLQNLFYAKGNLKYALGDILGARTEYEKGLDLVFGGMGWASVVQLLATVCLATSSSSSTTTTTTSNGGLSVILLQPDQALRITQIAFASTGGVFPGLVTSSSSSSSTTNKGSTKIQLQQSSPSIASVLLSSSNKHTIPPRRRSSQRINKQQRNSNTNQASSANIIQQSNQTTSTILLTLAKLFQDLMNPSTPALALAAAELAKKEQLPTLALLLPLYYLSLAVQPSPSTANNLGIILSNLPASITTHAIRLSPPITSSSSLNNNNLPAIPPLSGTMLAMQYYMYGLQLDPRHPHLYTNLGSLLKDMGHLTEAVTMYEKAVEYNPRFDVALANLGNAIKDMGRVQDSIQWYQRAVHVNPDFVDAVCGLINALGGVCDWRGRGYVYLTPTTTPTCATKMVMPIDDDKEKTTIMAMGVTFGEREPGMVNDFGQWIPLPRQHLSTTTLGKNQGWMGRLVEIVEQQLEQGAHWGQGVIKQQQIGTCPFSSWVNGLINRMVGLWLKAAGLQESSSAEHQQVKIWHQRLTCYLQQNNESSQHQINEGGWIVRVVERLTRRLQRQWYLDSFGNTIQETYRQWHRITQVSAQDKLTYARPLLSPENGAGNGLASTPPPVPTVLPFHTFTYPLTARQVRLISHRNALRISHATLASGNNGQSWLPTHVYPPPPPPQPRLRIGYVSSDFNNHPLSHLMQSIFGFHDRARFEVFCYATTPSDQSPYRLKIEREAEHFIDVSTWPHHQQIVDKILQDGIHVLVNLNGYTKGARNEIFAARPCPVQCSFMGFAGTLGGGWTDYIIADPIVCPPSTVSCEQWRQQQQQQLGGGGDLEGDLDPESKRDDVVYTEKFIYMPYSYFVNDHKQGFREEDHQQQQDEKREYNENDGGQEQLTLWEQEELKRQIMRREVFPDLPDDVVIFANFNQLYKLDPATFRLWLRILARVPNSILWLLRFPPAGEVHLRQWANDWAGANVASRVVFTDVAPKHIHIHRGRVADIFLDTPECNAHTTAADILWSGTPVITWPKYVHKMCSRVGASIAYATGFGHAMVVPDESAYEEKAVHWATNGANEALDLRRQLFLSREASPLFDTKKWTKHLELGYLEAWRRWVRGYEFEDLLPVLPDDDDEKAHAVASGCIWIQDGKAQTMVY